MKTRAMNDEQPSANPAGKHPFTPPYTRYTIYTVERCMGGGPDDGGPPVFCKVFEEQVLVSWDERRWHHKLRTWLRQLKESAYDTFWLSTRYPHTRYKVEVEGTTSIQNFLEAHPEWIPFVDKKYLPPSGGHAKS